MRFGVCVGALLPLGCSRIDAGTPARALGEFSRTDAMPAVRESRTQATPPAASKERNSPGHPQSLPDLRTRKTGSDWPGFLGPFGTGISPEKGILTLWPKEGLRVLWQKPLGPGSAIPSISLSPLFQ